MIKLGSNPLRENRRYRQQQPPGQPGVRGLGHQEPHDAAALAPALPPAAGLLLALFAQPLTRIAALRMDDLDLTSDEVQITLGTHGPIPVPEPFGQILRDHAANRGPRNIEVNRTSPWLFPGNRPGQHIHSTYLMNQLAKSGINLLGTRLGAMRSLVLEMPPAVAAQALGYTADYAEDHAILAGATWASYPSHRRPHGELAAP